MPHKLLQALAILPSFIQRLAHSSAIVHYQPSMDHHLDLSLANHRTALRSITNDSDRPAACLVLSADERVDWVIIACSWLENCIVPSGSVVKCSLLLFKTHRISVEDLAVLVLCLQVKSHFLAHVISDGNTIDEGFN